MHKRFLPEIKQTTARVLHKHFFAHFGFPAKIHSDKGTNFELKVIQSLCRITGMKKTITTPYHPMGNGMVERFNLTLLNILGTLTRTQKSDWKSHISTLCACIHSLFMTERVCSLLPYVWQTSPARHLRFPWLKEL